MTDVIGILGFALHAAHKVYTMIEAIKDAPRDIQALRDDALQVHAFLQKVLNSQDCETQAGTLCGGDVQDPQIDTLVKRAQSISTMVENFISRTTTQNDNGRYEIKKLKWPLYSGEARKLAEQFKAFYLSLTAAYSISTFTTLDDVLSNQRTQQLILANHGDMLHTIFKWVTLQRGHAVREQREGCSTRFDGNCAIHACPPSGAIAVGDTDSGRPATTAVVPSADFSAAVSHLTRIRDTEQDADGVDKSHAGPQTYDGSACACPSELRPIPSWLNPWIGELTIPHALVQSLFPVHFLRDNMRCPKSEHGVQTVRYYLPVWLTHVEALIRFEAFPVHFCIQTPRVVPSLRHLGSISFDEFRAKLSSREITVFDVEPDGNSVFHRLLRREQNVGDAFDLITYALDAGLPLHWQFETMTAVESAAYFAQLIPDFRIRTWALDLKIVRPLLHTSLDAAFQELEEKLNRTDIHTFLLKPHPDVTQALDILSSMLALPGMKKQINTTDMNGSVPLDYATRAFPEAVTLLLQAGASPKVTRDYLLHQAGYGQWKAVSALIRAGYSMNERDPDNFGRPPLHFVAASQWPSYRYGLELMRHGGHRLDWNTCDDEGHTPLDIAQYFSDTYRDREQLSRICELYQAQSIPPHAQYISSFDSERLMTTEEVAVHPCISLVDSCLAGDIASIGPLISAGAMVNERDGEGRTLLHLVAMGDRVPNAYRVALELERHAKYGIDHNAAFNGKTAREIAKQTLQQADLGEHLREDVKKIVAYLDDPSLPEEEHLEYVFPCMDPRFCNRCCSLRCSCVGYDTPNIPGTFKS